MTRQIFSEKQRMRQWWVLLLSFGGVGFATYALLYQLITGEGLGSNPPPLFVMFIIEGLMLLMFVVVWQMELQTRMDAAGIHYKFWPLFGWRHRPWTDLQSVEVRHYKPLLEYGGWGIRLGTKGWAYNIAGNQGIQLVLKNGDRLLLGTQKPAEAEAAIARLNAVPHD